MPTSHDLLERVDHLVYAAPDLGAAVDDMAHRLGVRATAGGRHPGRGTRNALLALGHASYLEIVAIDPEQSAPAGGRWFGVDSLSEPRLMTWAAKGTALARLASDAARRGVALGPVISGSRQRADGVTLSWAFTDPSTVVADGIVPFFIDWGNSPHPAVSAAGGVTLVGLRAVHPEPALVRRMLHDLALDMTIDRGPHPALIATLLTSRGELELR